MGRALVRPRTGRRGFWGGAVVGHQVGPQPTLGWAPRRATLPWTVRNGTRKATIPLCPCDSRAPVGHRSHDGHGVCLRMDDGEIVRRSTPTLPPVRFRTLELPHSTQMRRPATPMLLPPEGYLARCSRDEAVVLNAKGVSTHAHSAAHLGPEK